MVFGFFWFQTSSNHRRARAAFRSTCSVIPPPSFALHFDGFGQVQSAPHLLSNDDLLSMLNVPGQDAGFEPLEAPGIFDSHDCVVSGDYALQRKRAVEIALIATKQVDV